MGKLKDELQFQLTTDKSEDAKECLTLYDILLEETGKVWDSQWNALTQCVIVGNFPATKRLYKLNSLDKAVIKGYNCK